MLRLTLLVLSCMLLPPIAWTQQVDSGNNPFGDTSADDADWTPLHPDGETPHERMLSLVHTEALLKFDRTELFAVSVDGEDPKRNSTDKTFPVRPYGVHADILAHKTVTGDACRELRNRWQKLAFDRLGGAMCHYPVYGFRLYRGESLLFETTVCWECQNFYVPRYNSEKRRYTYGWYGFANDHNAKSLLEFFRSHLPRPRLQTRRTKS